MWLDKEVCDVANAYLCIMPDRLVTHFTSNPPHLSLSLVNASPSGHHNYYHYDKKPRCRREDRAMPMYISILSNFTTASCGFSATAWLSCIVLHQRPFKCWNYINYADFHGRDVIYGDSRKSQHTTDKATMIDIIEDTDNIGPSLLHLNHSSQVHSTYYKHLTQAAWTQVYFGNMYCIWLPEELPRIIRIYLIFIETTIIGRHFAASNMSTFVEIVMLGTENFVYFCNFGAQLKARMWLPISP